MLDGMVESLAPRGRVLLIEDTFDVGEPDAEADLVNLTLYGSGHRTDAELDALITGAWLQTDREQGVGWTTVRLLTRV